MTHKSKAIHVASRRLKDKNDSRLANYAFTDRDYNKPQTIDQNKIIMQI